MPEDPGTPAEAPASSDQLSRPGDAGDPVARANAPATHPGAPSGSVIRVVVVDDDFRVGQIHAAYLGRVPGFVCVGEFRTAATGAAAIVDLAPDLVLLDLYLPDAHGFELLAQLRASPRAGTDVMVISAAREVDDLRRAMALGAVHYLLKPFTFETFRDKLLAYAGRRSALDGAPATLTDQASIDRVLGSLRGASGVDRALPKGLAEPTLAAIEAVLADAAGGVGALEVAARVGISRATAQRYLTHLAASGRAVNRPRYGAAGRPEHIYFPPGRG